MTAAAPPLASDSATRTAISPATDPPATSTQRPLAVRIPEACRLTGIGRSKLYELIREGRIRTIKVGASTIIPMASLERFVGEI